MRVSNDPSRVKLDVKICLLMTKYVTILRRKGGHGVIRMKYDVIKSHT